MPGPSNLIIAHHRVGGDIDSEDFDEQRQAVHEPGLVVVKVLTGIPILATQEGPAHVARDTMVVVKRIVQRDNL